MKFKKILLGITGALAFTFALTACGDDSTNKDSTPAPAPSTDTGSDSGGDSAPATFTNYLTFMNDNKLRVDIMNNDLGVTFNYGNEAIQSTRETTLSADTKLSFSGEFAVEKVNFVVVSDTSTGGSVSVSKGVDSSRVGDFLSRYPMTGKKIYIAISSGEVNWTKGLNTKMDTEIGTYLPKA
jgi:hypothetical protein